MTRLASDLRTVSCIAEITEDLANLTVTHLFTWGVVVCQTRWMISSSIFPFHNRSSWVTEFLSGTGSLGTARVYLFFNWWEAGLTSPELIWGRFSWYCPDLIFSTGGGIIYHYITIYINISLDITINYYVRDALGVFSPFSYCIDRLINHRPKWLPYMTYTLLTVFLRSILRPKLRNQLNEKRKANEYLKTVLFEYSVFTTSYYISMNE